MEENTRIPLGINVLCNLIDQEPVDEAIDIRISAIAISWICELAAEEDSLKFIDVLAHLSELGVGVGKSGLFDIDEVSRGLKRDIIGIQTIWLIDFQQETRIADIDTVAAILYFFSNVIEAIVLAVDEHFCEMTTGCPRECRAFAE